MATDLEKLTVQLSADIKKFEGALNRAAGITNKQMGAIQRKTDALTKGIGVSFARAGVAIAAGLATGKVAQEILKLSESATRIDNALKVAGLSGAELEVVYKRLNAAAIENGAPIETLVQLYSKAAQSQKELGATSAELIEFSGNVALALRVAGTDAAAAQGALLQLGQALGSGTVHAEEFNSVLEGAPTIAQAVAAGLKEAGGSVAKLKALIVDGKVSSEAFFRAFEAGAPVLQQKVAGSTRTVAMATNDLETALIDAAREFNAATGAGEKFAGGVDSVARTINAVDISGFIEKLRAAKAEFEGLLGSLGNAQVFKDLNEAMGVTNSDGNVINLDASDAKDETASLEKEVATLQDRIALNTSLGFDNTEALARLGEVQQALANIRAAAANMPATVPGLTVGESGIKPTSITDGAGPLIYDRFSPPAPPVKPISTNDFAPPASSKGGGGGGRKKSGGGSARENEYQREIEQIKERTLALQAETAAQEALGPIFELEHQ